MTSDITAPSVTARRAKTRKVSTSGEPAGHASSNSVAPVAVAACLALAGLLTACGEASRQPEMSGVGPQPVLPAPVRTLMPTVNIAPAIGWAQGQKPVAAAGLQVDLYADQLEHPRWPLVLPNGDVLIAETNAPPKPQDGGGIKGWVMKLVMGRAGAGTPSPNRITLLRDADGDGRPETRAVFLQGLHSPFGMAVVGDKFYVANADAIWEYPYQLGQTSITAAGRKLTDLPGGPINHHWTKNIIPSADGSKLYATVGSNSNVAENGIPAEEGRAAIWEIDRASGTKRIYASGLRNPNGMVWDESGTLWTVVNERDEIGSDLVPDYLTSVRDGGFYGWPYSYYGQHVDTRVEPQWPDMVAKAIVPTYALGAHVAALGLATNRGANLPGPMGTAAAPAGAPAGATSASASASPGAVAPFTGMFIGEHGSWNRNPRSGYKVVFVSFNGGQPTGQPVDVLTGFVNAEGKAQGRPVGVAIDRAGALLVVDDVGNAVWRVTGTK